MPFKIQCTNFVTTECLQAAISGASNPQTLAQTLVEGNETGGLPIVVSGGDAITTNPSDDLSLQTGDNPAGDTGNIVLDTGTSTGGDKGDVLLANPSSQTRLTVQYDLTTGTTASALAPIVFTLFTAGPLTDTTGRINAITNGAGIVANTEFTEIMFSRPFVGSGLDLPPGPVVLISNTPVLIGGPGPSTAGVNAGLYVSSLTPTSFRVAVANTSPAATDLSFSYMVIGAQP